MAIPRVSLVTWLALAIASILTIGCGPTPSEATKGTSGSEKSPGSATSPKSKDATGAPEAFELDLRTVDVDGYNAEIAKHKGKVVFVDFWATWCGPCVAQFPHTVELHEKYKSEGLDVISMSLDDEGEEPAVREFLLEKKADFPNLRSEYGAGVESSDNFELKAAVPHFRLYDRSGKLRESWDGEPEGVEQKIEELLKEAP